MKNIFLFSIMFFLVFSCNKEKIEPIIQTDDKEELSDNLLNIIWTSKLTSDGSISRSIDPLLTEDGVLISVFQISKNEVVKKFNRSTGDMIWTWSDFVNPNPGQRVIGHDKTFLYEEILVANSSQDNYGINHQTGETEWSSFNDYNGPYSSISNDMLFSTLKYGFSGAAGDSSSIVHCHPKIGNWKTIFKVKKQDDFEKSLTTPISFFNQQNDTLIIFQNRQHVSNPYEIKVDLHCYNITQQRMEWEHLEVDQWGNSNIRTPLIDSDYCYFVGLASAYCFNIHTGEKVWQYDHDVAWQLSNFLIHENNLIIKDDQSNLLAINKNSGQLSWKNEDASGCCVTMRLYGDRLYVSVRPPPFKKSKKGVVLLWLTKDRKNV